MKNSLLCFISLFVWFSADSHPFRQGFSVVNPVIGDISFVEKYGVLPNRHTDNKLRIKTHLEYVEKVLRSRDVSSWSLEKQRSRNQMLNLLHEYCWMAVFPKNYDYPNTRIPCFIDKEGAICAVGYLLARTAGIGVAEKINSMHQYDVIMDMQETFISEWIESSGLTREECAMIQPGYPGEGELDIFRFGSKSNIITDFGIGTNDCFSIMTTKSLDYKIYVGCNYADAGEPRVAIVALNFNGNIDSTFGGTQKGVAGIDFSFVGTSMAMQDDGKIIVAGYNYNLSKNNPDFVVWRYTPKGIPDSTFNKVGFVSVDFEGRHDIIQSAVVVANGKIILVGSSSASGNQDFAAVRLLQNGELDLGFGEAGLARINMGGVTEYANSVVLQDDERILIGGTSLTSTGYRMAAIRLLADGQPDPSFSEDGRIYAQFGQTNSKGAAVKVLPDGKILLCGNGDGSSENILIARYKSNGYLDSSFRSNGELVLDVDGSFDRPPKFELLSRDKILIGTTSMNNQDTNFLLVRLNGNGEIDTKFGFSGKVQTDIATSSLDQMHCMAVATPGDIICGGKMFASGSSHAVLTRHYGTTRTTNVASPNPSSYFGVFPNPAEGKIQLQWSGDKNAILQLFDITGKTIWSRSYDCEIHLGDLPKGVYFLKISDGKIALSEKIFVK